MAATIDDVEASNDNLDQQAKAQQQSAKEDGAHGKLRHYSDKYGNRRNIRREAQAEAQRQTAGAEW